MVQCSTAQITSRDKDEFDVQCSTAQITSRDKDEFDINKLGSILKMKVTVKVIYELFHTVKRHLPHFSDTHQVLRCSCYSAV